MPKIGVIYHYTPQQVGDMNVTDFIGVVTTANGLWDTRSKLGTL